LQCSCMNSIKITAAFVLTLLLSSCSMISEKETQARTCRAESKVRAALLNPEAADFFPVPDQSAPTIKPGWCEAKDIEARLFAAWPVKGRYEYKIYCKAEHRLNLGYSRPNADQESIWLQPPSDEPVREGLPRCKP
jgi:hypothetical protein